MPRPSIGARAKPSSNSSAKPPQKAAPLSPQFTKSKQSSPGKSPSDSGSDHLDPEATDPFPPGLFRVPVPNRVFSEMGDMSDAALRCLLGLIHRSWRFDPKESAWIHTEEWLSRTEVQEETGLSSQGTREGLSALEERGWAEVDRSGRSYRYRLRMNVPTRRYTYLPTALLDRAGEMESATALRVLLVVFRRTWGWAREKEDPDTGTSQTVHRRWARLSKADLAGITGHSDTAISQAVTALEGTWLGRLRPDSGAHFYRILPEAFGPDSEEGGSTENGLSSPPTANTVAPHRQHSCPPTSYREKGKRNKQSQKQQTQRKSAEAGPSETGKNAMPGDSPTGNPSQKPQNPETTGGKEEPPDSPLEDLPPEKKSLAEKLINAGVWPERAKECLSRYSERRIEANFELYRQRAPEIKDDGAWLCAAITDGYANLSSRNEPEQAGPAASDGREEAATRQKPKHKQKVSREEKKALIRHCPEVEENHFHRYQAAQDPAQKQFLYLDPARGGPKRRGASRRSPA